MKEFEKSQIIRLADIFFIGPLIIYGGFKSGKEWLKWALILIGIATILYNGNNYLKNKVNDIPS